MSNSIMNSVLFGSTTCEHSGVSLRKPKDPVRMEYETQIRPVDVGVGGYLFPINIVELAPHSGKKARVIVEIIDET